MHFRKNPNHTLLIRTAISPKKMLKKICIIGWNPIQDSLMPKSGMFGQELFMASLMS